MLMGNEACAVEVAVSPTPRTCRLRRRWRFRLGAGASSYAIVPVGLLAQLPSREPPQTSVRLSCLPLGFEKALLVLHVGWEGGYLGVPFFYQHLVEHLPVR